MDNASGEVQYEGTKVGVITHFFDKISVAVVSPEVTFNVGDKVKIYDKEGNVVVEQEIASMQIDGEDKESVEGGTEFGMKVEGDVKEGYTIYRQ